MKSDIEIRPAREAEAAAIVAAVRSGFSADFLKKTIYGCEGIAQYIEEQIAAHDLLGDTLHLVACSEGNVVGCIEVRRLPTTLFLNYLSVLPTARSRGVGKLLFRKAIELGRTPLQTELCLDVLVDNHRAADWYARLGFRAQYTSRWIFPPAVRRDNAACNDVLLQGYPQAQACQRAFGFSEFSVITRTARHSVGRIGRQWFRLTNAEALNDMDLMLALMRIDPTRELFLILREDATQSDDEAIGRTFARTRRMVMSVEAFLSDHCQGEEHE